MTLMDDFKADVSAEFANLEVTEPVNYRVDSTGAVLAGINVAMSLQDGQHMLAGGVMAMAGKARILKSDVAIPKPSDKITRADGSEWYVLGIVADGGATYTAAIACDLRPRGS